MAVERLRGRGGGRLAGLADDGQHVLAGDAAARAAAGDAGQIDAHFAGEAADGGAGGDVAVVRGFGKRGGLSGGSGGLGAGRRRLEAAWVRSRGAASRRRAVRLAGSGAAGLVAGAELVRSRLAAAAGFAGAERGWLWHAAGFGGAFERQQHRADRNRLALARRGP